MKKNIKEIEIENPLDGSVVKHILIDKGNGEFTSMPKSTYDEIIATQLTSIDIEDE
jgi:predicted aspartyl protease